MVLARALPRLGSPLRRPGAPAPRRGPRRCFHKAPLEALANAVGDPSPVLLIEMLALEPAAGEDAWREHGQRAARDHGGRCVASVRPFPAREPPLTPLPTPPTPIACRGLTV